MKIGIDLDGVLFNSEACFSTYAEIFDIEREGSGPKKEYETKVNVKYGWDEDVLQIFFDECLLPIERKAPLMPYASEILENLKKYGNQLIVITSRGLINPEEIEISNLRFKEENLVFDKEYFNVVDKSQVCVNEKIDVMIEDNYDNILAISDKGITCLYFRAANMRKLERDNVFEVHNWGEIYRKVLELEQN